MKEFLFSLFSHTLFVKAIIAIIASFFISYFSKFVKHQINLRISDIHSRYNARKLVVISAYIAIIIVIAIIFTQQLKGFTITLGLIGAVVAYTLRNLISSLAGWFAITFGKYYQVGDRIEINNIKGDVIDINFFNTILMECGEWIKSDLYTGRIVRISNNNILNSPLYNYSRDLPFLWDEITIPVRYGSDIRLAREIFEEITVSITEDFSTKSEKDWKNLRRKFLLKEAKISSTVTLIATDNWIEFTIRYVVDYKKRRIIKDLIFTKILEKINTLDGKIQLSSATIELVAIPDLKVNFKY